MTVFSITISLDFKNPKWSNEVEKNEMNMVWCIYITNNVKTYKKLNEIAQMAKFTVFIMCGRELPADKAYFSWNNENLIFDHYLH